MIDKLRELAIKFEEIGEKLTLPDVVSDQKRYKDLSKEYKDLGFSRYLLKPCDILSLSNHRILQLPSLCFGCSLHHQDPL